MSDFEDKQFGEKAKNTRRIGYLRLSQPVEKKSGNGSLLPVFRKTSRFVFPIHAVLNLSAHPVMRPLGRFLQLFALLALPIALVAFYNAPVYLFAALGFCASAFVIGRLVEGYAR